VSKSRTHSPTLPYVDFPMRKYCCGHRSGKSGRPGNAHRDWFPAVMKSGNTSSEEEAVSWSCLVAPLETSVEDEL
jgi:hypothetical protein